MASAINERQLRLLRAIEGEQPLNMLDGAVAGTVRALERRGLFTVRGPRGARSVELTETGRARRADKTVVAPTRRPPRQAKPAPPSPPTAPRADRPQPDQEATPSSTPPPSAPRVPVVNDLRKPHPVVAATTQRVKEMRPRINQVIHTSNQTGTLDLRVTKATLHRALRIAQSPLGEAERRGHTVAARGDAGAITVDGHAYAFKIDEPLDRVPREPTKAELDRKARNPWITIPDYTEVPSGRLRLRLPVT